MATAPYYAQSVDFDFLARSDESFLPIVAEAKRTGHLDFQDPEIVRILTRTILKVDFGGLVLPSLPPTRLCPPVPVRWNYVKWIQDLLASTQPAQNNQTGPEQDIIRGLDIGTGATGIYAMLACSTKANWMVTGTEMDQLSADSATANFEANAELLGGRAKVLKVTGSTLIPSTLGFEPPITNIDFVMTNPPFYSSLEDMQSSYISKSAPPSAVCTGSENEMICQGGDVGFVSRLLEESLQLKTRIRWYSAMMGKLSSLQEIVSKLKKAEIRNWAVCCVQAGKRTKRWLVAWSFHDYRPTHEIAHMGELVHAVVPPATNHTIVVHGAAAAFDVGEKVDRVIRGLEVKWEVWDGETGGTMLAKGNAWSRAARRKKRFQGDVKMATADDGDEEDDDDDEVALGVKITCNAERVELWWFRGFDQVLFMSFCAMLKRALNETTGR